MYLEDAADVDKVIDYVDGRHLQGRQVRAKRALGGDDSKVDKNENDTINWNETSVDDVVAYVTRLRSQLRVALLTANPDESQNQHVKQMFA